MKTTSFEMSKKLAELGVELPTRFYWKEKEKPIGTMNGCLQYHSLEFFTPQPCFASVIGIYSLPGIPAYNLEDILEVLSKIKGKARLLSLELNLFEDEIKSVISIDYGKGWLATNFYFRRSENETLTDTAARLLIKLIENQIIHISKEEC